MDVGVVDSTRESDFESDNVGSVSEEREVSSVEEAVISRVNGDFSFLNDHRPLGLSCWSCSRTSG